MELRRSRQRDQPTSRLAGIIVSSICAVFLMIICLVVVIIVWATENHAPAAPKSEAGDHGELPTIVEQLLSSYYYPVSVKSKVTRKMRVAPERNDRKIWTSGDVHVHKKTCSSIVENIEKGAISCNFSGIVCDCTSRGLKQVPKKPQERVKCTALLLGDNCLIEIPSNAFANFTELEILDLRDNQIIVLNVNAFQGLPKLQSLILQHNLLLMNWSFPPGIFQNLNSLKYLDISGNIDDFKTDYLQYPGEALRDLKNLRELAIDGLNGTKFPSDFENMTSLSTLNMGGPYKDHCRLGIVEYDTFQYLQNLKTLNISYCHLTDISVLYSTFYGLTNLVTLDISWNEKFGIANVLTFLHQLPNKNILTHLNVSHVSPSYAKSCSISKKLVQALSKLKGLKVITAQRNGFESIDGDVFKVLPENLIYLDVSDNRFVFGKYLAKMSLMANLETLLVNGANVVYNVPTSYPTGKSSGCPATLQESTSENGHTSKELVFQLPPKLKRLSMIKAGLSYRLTKISVNSNNALKELSLDENVFSHLEGPLYGLDRLTSLSMAGCSIESITETFFQNLTSLENLDLSNNLIGLHLPADGNVSLFKDLVHLKYLNLSFNSISEMEHSREFLKGLDNLEELYIQNNRLWSFNMDISHMHKLRVLNLSCDFLSSLKSDVTTFIQSLVIKSNASILVQLSRNFIKCECDNLPFLRWLSSSKAVNKSLFTERYLCDLPDINSHSIVKDGYSSVIHKLTKECSSNYGLYLVTVFGTLIFMSLVLAVILYRFRWNVRYLYYAAYLSVKKRGRPVIVIEEDYPYDVFLSYARPDEEFIVSTLCPALETRGLKLHVHGRDFVAGDYIASNIVTAVKESRKTLVVLTRALLESTWCNYEIQMANMESVHTGRPVLIFLIKESVSNRQLGQNLLSHIRNNTYIPYPESGPAQEPGNHLLEAFWDKLAADLKS